MVWLKRRRGSYGVADVIFVVLAVVGMVVSPHAIDAGARAVHVTRQVVELWGEYLFLVKLNAGLESLAKYTHTDKGKELIVRARCGYLPKNAVVVILDAPPPAPPAKVSIFRAAFDKMRSRVAEVRSVVRWAWWLVKKARNPDFPECNKADKS